MERIGRGKSKNKINAAENSAIAPINP